MTKISSSDKCLRILYIASEVEPLVKVGGLGDVAGSLPKALDALDLSVTRGYDMDIRMVIPYHAEVRKKLKEPEFVSNFEIQTKEDPVPAQAFLSRHNGVMIYLIGGPPIPFDGTVYSRDAHLDSEKYIFFSLASLELTRHINWAPHIIMANDWHTAIAAYAFSYQRKSDEHFQDTHAILVIHNLPYMGADCLPVLERYLIPPPQAGQLPDWAQRVPLPLGILAADHIVTVSPTYAEEIMTPEFGCGLDEYLRANAERVSGILNGLSHSEWNPETDQALTRTFSSESVEAKAINKQALLEKLSLDTDLSIPLLYMITRMDHQKGVDLAVDALARIMDRPWQAIILGTGSPVLENACRNLEAQYPDRIRALIRFDTTIAREIYAAGDILIMPSRYEPCGLTQMIAMRYGCVPVARATGGLKDTIIDDPDGLRSTGFLFDKPESIELASALERAMKFYLDRDKWRTIQVRCMEQDFSWRSSAIPYVDLFLKLRGEI